MPHDVPTRPGHSADPDTLTLAFSMLANTRRRNVLRFLLDRRSSTLSTLVDEVVGLEVDEVVGLEVDGSDRPTDGVTEDVRLSLLHVHLPKLDTSDFVDYDPDVGRVTLLDTPSTRVVESVIDRFAWADLNR